MSNNNKATLHYFNGRGRAEIIRLVFAATYVDWDFIPFRTREAYLALAQSKLAFAQTPLVEFQGKNMVQTQAIVHYFARKGNLIGRSAEEEYEINKLYDASRSLYQFFMDVGFKGFADYIESLRTNPMALSRYLPVFEKTLAANRSSGFLCGDAISLADLGLFECTLSILDYLGPQALNPYPEILKFHNSMKAIPRLSKYLSSSQRKGVNTPESFQEIRDILGF
jgi:glutathione S-transferase